MPYSTLTFKPSKPKRMPSDFEKPVSICLCKNKIEDTKPVQMKFIPTADFFDQIKRCPP